MNIIENWIAENKAKLPESFGEKFREIGFHISNVLPPVFDSYALIYHPYKIPIGELITEKREIELQQKQLLERINALIENEIGIPANELPNERYDFEKVVREKLESKKVNNELINKQLSIIEKQAFSIALGPLQKTIDSIKEGKTLEGENPSLKEVSWKELYDFYGIEFNEKTMWATLSKRIKSEDYIIGQEMAEMDNIPKSVLIKIFKFLKNKNIEEIHLNAHKELKSEYVPINSIIERDRINIIASPKKEWIFINPYDFCRTIVAGKSEFIKEVIESKLFEISIPVNENHRLDVNE